MSLVVRPQREDFFPKTKRGHGSKRPYPRVVKSKVLDAKTGKQVPIEVFVQSRPCVDPTCALNNPKSTNHHEDRQANLREWCSEHKLSVVSKDNPNAQFDSPVEALYFATGGWRF